MVVAILGQNGNRIGLFEHIRIIQGHEELHMFRRARHPLALFLEPRACLVEEMYNNGPITQTIKIAEFQTINNNVSFTRIPYVVYMWEDSDFFPVYTLNPDYFLPWDITIQTSLFQNRLRHFRIQNNPVRMPRRAIRHSDICPITLAPLTLEDAYWLPCGHSFSDAIYQAAAVNNRCPLCRNVFQLSDIQH
jgi:hypothetical protein